MTEVCGTSMCTSDVELFLKLRALCPAAAEITQATALKPQDR